MIFDAVVCMEELLIFCDPAALKGEDCYLIKTFEFKKEDKQAEEILRYNPDSDVLLKEKVQSILRRKVL